MTEFWLPIEGFSGYTISNLGRVRRGNVLVKATLMPGGYLHVRMKSDLGGWSRKFVAKLVVKAFNGEGRHKCYWCGKRDYIAEGAGAKRPGLRADHLDTIKTNNAAGNLVLACNRCNTSRDRKDLITSGELAVRSSTTHTRMTRAEERVCKVCGKTFLRMLAASKGPKQGQTCSRSCSNSLRWKERALADFAKAKVLG